MEDAPVDVFFLLKVSKLLTFIQNALFCLLGLKTLLGVTGANST